MFAMHNERRHYQHERGVLGTLPGVRTGGAMGALGLVWATRWPQSLD